MQKPEIVNKRVGTKVGAYTLERVIGLGGMASVYAVTHANGERFAMKILHRPLTTDDVAVARFFEEAYLANSVKHPGVCRVSDDGVSEDRCPYLVMDLLEGRTLEARLEEEGCLTIGDALASAIELADTLTQVHAAGIVHRDIKPPNVFITDSGVMKLLDFGVGKSRAIAMKTVAGALLGTPAYMAPEQALGASVVDARADVFSLGAVLFQCLTGEQLHVGLDAYAAWFAAATKPARSLAELAPEAPQDLVALVDRALAFDREDRWPTAALFRNEGLRVRASLSDDVAQSKRGRSNGPAGSYLRMLNELAPSEP